MCPAPSPTPVSAVSKETLWEDTVRRWPCTRQGGGLSRSRTKSDLDLGVLAFRIVRKVVSVACDILWWQSR